MAGGKGGGTEVLRCGGAATETVGCGGAGTEAVEVELRRSPPPTTAERRREALDASLAMLAVPSTKARSVSNVEEDSSSSRSVRGAAISRASISILDIRRARIRGPGAVASALSGSGMSHPTPAS
jgi:hypothetical protein